MSFQTVSALTTFFLVMALYPGVQSRAQSEIDELIPDRLPTFDDYDTLPYITVIIKEIMRWGPVAPLGGEFNHLISVTLTDTWHRYPFQQGYHIE